MCGTSRQKKAIETGVLELIERDAFMNAYLGELDMPIILKSSLPKSIQKRIRDLQSVGFEVSIIDHSLDLAPVVFVFAQSTDLHYTTCASCSSFEVVHATSHALMEVEASILHRLQYGKPDEIAPSDVSWPSDHGSLYGQEQFFERANFLAKSKKIVLFEEIGGDSCRDWNTLVEYLNSNNWKLLVIPLNLSESLGGNGDLNIVRVIIPGLVQMTFGSDQEPLGMKRIYEIATKFGNKNISYTQLNRFPHPFE